MEKKPTTRIILEDQDPYVGITNQRLEVTGRWGKTDWVDAGGGGDLFDVTVEQRKIIKDNGSPVIVYPNGSIETV
jgi:hypothetical protein